MTDKLVIEVVGHVDGFRRGFTESEDGADPLALAVVVPDGEIDGSMIELAIPATDEQVRRVLGGVPRPRATVTVTIDQVGQAGRAVERVDRDGAFGMTRLRLAMGRQAAAGEERGRDATDAALREVMSIAAPMRAQGRGADLAAAAVEAVRDLRNQREALSSRCGAAEGIVARIVAENRRLQERVGELEAMLRGAS